jgi:hypothetical protein
MFSQLRSQVGTVWCTLAHNKVMWPVHGHYECRECGRLYPAFAEEPAGKPARRAALQPALPVVLAVILATFAHPAHAVEALTGRHLATEAQAALDRYTAAAAAAPWEIESIEIHASLPGLEKTGELQAIRRLPPRAGSRYQVLQLAGDRMVKDQVIVRYLHAEEKAADIPAAAVAISPANYKFVYKGVVDDGERLAYVFQITPRRKRVGLIKGELWLDQHTGVLVRESGRLVKSPSVFIKRVAVTQENTLRHGVVESRLTHIRVDTRLVGRAELVIEERPINPVETVQLTGRDHEGGQQ